MSKMIGINLGTTNCSVAIMEKNTPKIVMSANGALSIPALVAFANKNEILVGNSALKQAVSNPEGTVFSAKRMIGRRFNDSLMLNRIKYLPNSVTKAENGDAWIIANDENYSPIQILAVIIQELKETAESYLNEFVTQAVISVPACFNSVQRRAIIDAGKIAGLEIIRLINEPSAAALNYGINLNEEKTIVAINIGGGSFDVSIIVIDEGVFEVKSTYGDTLFGGEDFDVRIVDFLVKEFIKENGIDLRNDILALQRLKKAAELAKIKLSTSVQTEINLPFISTDASGPIHLSTELSRKKFEQIVDDLIQQIIKSCTVALNDAGLQNDNIDEILFVGGMTHIPKIQEVVNQFFGRGHNKTVDPEESVVKGTAIFAGIMQGDVEDMLLLDVISHSVGIELLSGATSIFIERNTIVPEIKTWEISHIERNHLSEVFRIFEGIGEMEEEKEVIGELDLQEFSTLSNKRSQIEVCFNIDPNGIVHTSATDEVTDKTKSVYMKQLGRLSDTEFKEMKKNVESFSKKKSIVNEIVEITRQYDLIIRSIEKSLSEYKSSLEEESKVMIETAISELKTTLDGSNVVEMKSKYELLLQTFENVDVAMNNNLLDETDNASNSEKIDNHDYIKNNSSELNSQNLNHSDWDITEIISENETNSALILTNSEKDSEIIKEKILKNQHSTLKSWHGGKLDSRVFNFSAIPAIKEGLAKGKVYELVADPSIVKGIKNGTLEYTRNNLGFMTAVKNVKSGKFAGSAALKQSPQNLLKLPTIAWQVMHIIVATTELNKINERLDTLQRSFDDMRFRQESTIVGKILNAINRLDEIAEERTETGKFTPDMKNRLNSIEEVVGSIYERNKILVESFGKEADNTKKETGKTGATQAKILLNEKGSQAENDMILLTVITKVSVKIEQLKLLYLMEHNVNFLEKQMEISHEKVNSFREVISNFPSIQGIKEHAQKCVTEMGWWSRSVTSRGLIKDVENMVDFKDIHKDEIPQLEFEGGKYAIFNDENGETQTYLLSNQSIEK